MATNDTQLPAAEKTKLLKESLNVIVLAAVMSTISTTPRRSGGLGSYVASTTNKPEPKVHGFFARVYKRVHRRCSAGRRQICRLLSRHGFH